MKCRVRVHEEIDIRGENGYVVGPGSCINGKFYEIKIMFPLPRQQSLSIHLWKAMFKQNKEKSFHQVNI